MNLFNPKSILIIGFQGSLAKTTAQLLLEKFPEVKIHGVDSRSMTGITELPRLSFERIRYTRTHFEKIFREQNFDCILHLGRIGTTKLINDMTSKININLIGTNTILELAYKYKCKKVIILSTHHVYGALADNSMFLREESPLRASFHFPDLRDVVEMDQMCTNWMWKNQNTIETIVLRPANIIGPQINNSISKYLKSSLSPFPIDYNPMMQFIHEFDMSQIISESVEKLTTGIFNIASDEILTLQDAIQIVGIKKIPAPLFLVEKTSRFLRPVWKFPHYLIDFLKYPAVIDSSEFKKRIGHFEFKYSTKEALQNLYK